jgi:hypothetical protein
MIGAARSTPASFSDALVSPGPAPDRAAAMMLYGQFVGAWEGALRYRDAKGRWHETTSEVHFAWVLEGRAVQDVWIAPAPGSSAPAAMYGTTLRVYEPDAGRWQIVWIDPRTQTVRSMEGRQVGRDIVQECRTDDLRSQWLFTDIAETSFHWVSRESHDLGKTWTRQGEFFLHRSDAARG